VVGGRNGQIVRHHGTALERKASTADRHPLVAAPRSFEELEPGLAFVSSFANVTAFETDAGLVLVDVGSHLFAPGARRARRWSIRPLHTAIYTHGHIDHVFGVDRYDAEARDAGAPPPRVVAHEAVADRFDRYRMTAGYNAMINRRQFRVPDLVWPVDYRYPDVTYRKTLALDVGGTHFVLNHDRGETDDHTWVWLPERKVLCTGDLFIWASPNCGNPQKVQRYPLDWARGLRAMDALTPELLCPGHGYPIRGRDRVHQALAETAELLEFARADRDDERGARLNDILHAVRPAHLRAVYLCPVHDDPEFTRNTGASRRCGWQLAHLKPALTRRHDQSRRSPAGWPGRERAQAPPRATSPSLLSVELAAGRTVGRRDPRNPRRRVRGARRARAVDHGEGHLRLGGGGERRYARTDSAIKAWAA
jgi:glyoxylase-like metal-dependent hydrolase (beta-lactamase superfamily II)